jgi:hypothetical protein
MDTNADWMGTLALYYSKGIPSIYNNGSSTLICPFAPCIIPKFPSGNNNLTGTIVTAWDWTGAASDIVGSYGFNQWLYSDSGSGGLVDNGADPTFLYRNQGNISRPSLTPVLADSVWINYLPLETDTPPTSLTNPGYGQNGLSRCCIARHGSGFPKNAPSTYFYIPNTIMPGSIFLSLMDGHVEESKLQNLWTYYWHLGWVPSTTPP